jgi:hypothetical protein
LEVKSITVFPALIAVKQMLPKLPKTNQTTWHEGCSPLPTRVVLELERQSTDLSIVTWWLSQLIKSNARGLNR